MGSTVAEQLVEILEQADVRRIYGVVGDSLNPVVDAVRRSSIERVNIPSEQIGTGYFQETHPKRLFVECSHFCELLSRPAQMPRMARTAIQHATGLGGPAEQLAE